MGYEPFLFWELSLSEIYDLIESYRRKQEYETEKIKQQLKIDATFNAVLARQIGEYVASLFNKDARLTPLEKLYPNLFIDEVGECEESIAVERQLDYYKAKMDDFAFWHNARLKTKGGDSDE